MNNNSAKTVLGIDTTCDETAIGIVFKGKTILSNTVYSQTDLHKKYGGVFPELACRKHVDLLVPTIEKALKEANCCEKDIDLIAVSIKPGLIGALLVGLNAAKALAYAWKKPFVGVNHIEAHLYAAMMPLDHPPLPGIGLVISGGHTSLMKITSQIDYELIGNTVDDAVGEAFDKTARLLELSYPGGAQLEQLAKKGSLGTFSFKPGHVKGKPFHFSFSGLKTQVFYALKKYTSLDDQSKKDLAATFQETALFDLAEKSFQALKHFSLSHLYIGGGVSANKRLRQIFSQKGRQAISLFWPEEGLSTDNGAMVAALGYHIYQKKRCSDALDILPTPTK